MARVEDALRNTHPCYSRTPGTLTHVTHELDYTIYPSLVTHCGRTPGAHTPVLLTMVESLFRSLIKLPPPPSPLSLPLNRHCPPSLRRYFIRSESSFRRSAWPFMAAWDTHRKGKINWDAAR